MKAQFRAADKSGAAIAIVIVQDELATDEVTIPVLDGGHLLYYLVEAVRGRPVSERTQAVGLKVGLALVGTLMIMALYFDVMRLW